nr:fimbrial protein [uncultured Moellerella sp.]
MNRVISLKKLALLLMLYIVSHQAYAGYNCHIGQPIRDAYINGNHIINIPFDDASIGNLKTITATSAVPLGLYVNNNGKDYNAQCNGLSYKNENIGYTYFKTFYEDRQPSQAPRQTNISGISQYVRFVVSYCPSCLASVNFPYTGNAGVVYGQLAAPDNYTLTIVKTGKVLKSGYIDSGLFAWNSNRNAAATSSSFYLTSRLTIQPNSIYINILNCSLNQTNYNIFLGDWYDTQFTNIGDSSEMVDVPISLRCMAGTNINVTVTSSNGYTDAATGKINLTAGENSAKGIAIQLLDNNGDSIKLNDKFNQTNSAPEGDYIFKWKARYIKTANTITPGTANSTATVNIRYE